MARSEAATPKPRLLIRSAFFGGTAVGIVFGLAMTIPFVMAYRSDHPVDPGQAVAAVVSQDPAASSPTPTPTPEPVITPTPAPTAASGTYVVQSGDTLYSIGVRFGVTEDELRSWNTATYPSLRSSPRLIRIGWVLQVEPPPALTPSPTPPAASA